MSESTVIDPIVSAIVAELSRSGGHPTAISPCEVLVGAALALAFALLVWARHRRRKMASEAAAPTRSEGPVMVYLHSRDRAPLRAGPYAWLDWHAESEVIRGPDGLVAMGFSGEWYLVDEPETYWDRVVVVSRPGPSAPAAWRARSAPPEAG